MIRHREALNSETFARLGELLGEERFQRIGERVEPREVSTVLQLRMWVPEPVTPVVITFCGQEISRAVRDGQPLRNPVQGLSRGMGRPGPNRELLDIYCRVLKLSDAQSQSLLELAGDSAERVKEIQGQVTDIRRRLWSFSPAPGDGRIVAPDPRAIKKAQAEQLAINRRIVAADDLFIAGIEDLLSTDEQRDRLDLVRGMHKRWRVNDGEIELSIASMVRLEPSPIVLETADLTPVLLDLDVDEQVQLQLREIVDSYGPQALALGQRRMEIAYECPYLGAVLVAQSLAVDDQVSINLDGDSAESRKLFALCDEFHELRQRHIELNRTTLTAARALFGPAGIPGFEERVARVLVGQLPSGAPVRNLVRRAFELDSILGPQRDAILELLVEFDAAFDRLIRQTADAQLRSADYGTMYHWVLGEGIRFGPRASSVSSADQRTQMLDAGELEQQLKALPADFKRKLRHILNDKQERELGIAEDD